MAEATGFSRRAFAERLRQTLGASGMRNADLARALTISPNRVSEWCTAKQIPRMEYLAGLAYHLDVDLDWLVTGRRRAEARDDDLIEELVQATPTLRALAERGHDLATRHTAP